MQESSFQLKMKHTAGSKPLAAICFFMNLSNAAAFTGNESLAVYIKRTYSWERKHKSQFISNFFSFLKTSKGD